MLLALRLCAFACIGVGAAAHLAAQAQAPTAFEVASIKPRVGDAPLVGGGSAPDRYENPDTTLRFMIRVAYDLFDYQVVGGPEWIDSKRWAVSAKATVPVSRVVMRSLLRRLLEDRALLRLRATAQVRPGFQESCAPGD